MGILGVILDFMKGYLPLVFIYESGTLNNNFLIPAALAPVFGHAFPVFHKFKGGKAIAVTFGVWSAITRFRVSFIFAVILAVFQLTARIIKKGKGVSTEADGVMIVAGMMLLGIYLKVLDFSFSYIIIWMFNLGIFIYVNRGKLYKFYKEKTDKGIPYRY
jgi:glycerol-3-phosphate acyltransferase PlsY